MGNLREISQEEDFANVGNILSQPGLVIKGPPRRPSWRRIARRQRVCGSFLGDSGLDAAGDVCYWHMMIFAAMQQNPLLSGPLRA
jgi:hypothetical protein